MCFLCVFLFFVKRAKRNANLPPSLSDVHAYQAWIEKAIDDDSLESDNARKSAHIACKGGQMGSAAQGLPMKIGGDSRFIAVSDFYARAEKNGSLQDVDLSQGTSCVYVI